MKNQVNLTAYLYFQKLLLLNKTDRVKHSGLKNISDYVITRLMAMLPVSFAKENLQEKNKEDAFLRTRFRNWKKTLTSSRDHQQSKCHLAALTFEVTVP